jgi:hypothetical protein
MQPNLPPVDLFLAACPPKATPRRRVGNSILSAGVEAVGNGGLGPIFGFGCHTPFGQNSVEGHANWTGPSQGIGRQEQTLAPAPESKSEIVP